MFSCTCSTRLAPVMTVETRGLLAHQVYIGYIEMAKRLPELLPSGMASERHYVETVHAMLTGPVTVD